MSMHAIIIQELHSLSNMVSDTLNYTLRYILTCTNTQYNVMKVKMSAAKSEIEFYWEGLLVVLLPVLVEAALVKKCENPSVSIVLFMLLQYEA